MEHAESASYVFRETAQKVWYLMSTQTRPGHAKNKVYAIFKVGSLEIEKGEW